jgi:hypothetical protein
VLAGKKTRIAVAAAVLAVAGGGGAAIAAARGGGGPFSPSSFFDDVAKHLGISPQKLQDATKAAAIDQVDAALAAGDITQQQADALKAKIESSDYPLLGFGPFPGPLPGKPALFGIFETAASYLGVSVDQLRQDLDSGQSLADVAKAQGKSVDGLKQAILDAAKQRLDQAVKDGVLTAAEEKDLVNDHSFAHRFDGGYGPGPVGPRAFFGPRAFHSRGAGIRPFFFLGPRT